MQFILVSQAVLVGWAPLLELGLLVSFL